MKEFLKSASLLIGCILYSRLLFAGVPEMANITPLIAMAVFLPYMTSNKNIQMFLPVSMSVSYTHLTLPTICSV